MSKGQVAVLGFGVTGRAMLDYLLDHPEAGKWVLFTDAAIKEADLQRSYEERGVEFWCGPGAFPRLVGMDRVILSPGFDGRQPRFESLRLKGVEILSEIEFACRLLRAKIIAVTGTNGKSTTVSLIHHLLFHGGRESVLAGNIGIPLIAMVDQIGPEALVVLELSSFQLEEIVAFRPHVAVILNVTPDHLDRYPDMDPYTEAKLRIFENQGEADAAVVNADDPILRRYFDGFGRGAKFEFSRLRPVERGAFIDRGDVVLRVGEKEERIPLRENPLRGVHNLENILAAFLAVRLVGLDARSLAFGLSAFQGLPHRMEWVGTVKGVEFINDSKATNVDAAAKSIESIQGDLVLILGGKDKGGDFSLLRHLIARKVSRVLLIGQATETIETQLHDLRDKFQRVKDLAEAVETGYRLLETKRQGVVLLAPACASFDMFKNFEHRGDIFRQEVAWLRERMAHG